MNAPDHKHLLATNEILRGARELNEAEKAAVRAETHRYAAGDEAVEAELNKAMGAEK